MSTLSKKCLVVALSVCISVIGVPSSWAQKLPKKIPTYRVPVNLSRTLPQITSAQLRPLLPGNYKTVTGAQTTKQIGQRMIPKPAVSPTLHATGLTTSQTARIDRQVAAREILANVKKFVAQEGRFPQRKSPNAAERSLRKAFNEACIRAMHSKDAVSQELLALKEEWVTKSADRRSPQEVLAQVRAFIDENGYFPRQQAENETERSLRQAFDDACRRAGNLQDETIKELLTLKETWVDVQFSFRSPQEVLAQVKEFIAIHGVFPQNKQPGNAESSLRQAFDRACAQATNSQDPTDMELLALKEQWVRKTKTRTDPQQVLRNVQAFIDSRGYFPRRYSRDAAESSLRQLFERTCQKASHGTDSISLQLLALRDKWISKHTTYRTAQDVLTKVKVFIEEKGRFPQHESAADADERSLRQAFDRACKKAVYKNDATSRELLALKDNYVRRQVSPRSSQEVLAQVEAFIKQNGYFPRYNSTDVTERALLQAFDRACKKAAGSTDKTDLQLLKLREQWRGSNK